MLYVHVNVNWREDFNEIRPGGDKRQHGTYMTRLAALAGDNADHESVRNP
jgi:hypothetical protein